MLKTDTPHLWKRPGSTLWQARVRVPPGAGLKQTHIVRSLRTRDRSEALKRLPIAVGEIKLEIETARRKPNGTPKAAPLDCSEVDLKAALWWRERIPGGLDFDPGPTRQRGIVLDGGLRGGVASRECPWAMIPHKAKRWRFPGPFHRPNSPADTRPATLVLRPGTGRNPTVKLVSGQWALVSFPGGARPDALTGNGS